MAPRFVSESIVPGGELYDTGAFSRGEPPLPASFEWRAKTLHVRSLLRTWRGTKDDRGDTYLHRHYFEFETTGGAVAVAYFERQARRGKPRWYLFTLDEPATR